MVREEGGTAVREEVAALGRHVWKRKKKLRVGHVGQRAK
jgi:hypothetical protein